MPIFMVDSEGRCQPNRLFPVEAANSVYYGDRQVTENVWLRGPAAAKEITTKWQFG